VTALHDEAHRDREVRCATPEEEVDLGIALEELEEAEGS
jgi:hypothetical protein